MNLPLQEVSGLATTTGLWIAFILGLVFGFFLEQGGMGDARKIANQFYLRDLAVMKIMFSAVVTTALGLFWIAKFGWLDYDLIFVPPTYLWPQLLGGVIFGVGFVTGGLCPGTSCVAISSGRVDGFAVLLGLFTGIFVFNEVFDSVEKFYRSGALGSIGLPEFFSVPHSVILFGFVSLAMIAFVIAERLENSQAQQ